MRGNRSPRDRGGAVGGEQDAQKRLRTNRRQGAWSVWIGGLSVACVCAAALLAFASPAMRVRGVVVEGAERLPADEVEATKAAVRLKERTNLLRAPLRSMAAAASRLPWVQSASARRRPEGIVVVRVAPRRPAAAVEAVGGLWLADSAGVLIRPAAHAMLPVIALDPPQEGRAGLRLTSPGAVGGLAVAGLIGGRPRVGVTKIAVDPQGDLCLNMSDGVLVRLGQPDELKRKVEFVRRIYASDPPIASLVVAVNLCNPEYPACVPRVPSSSAVALSEATGLSAAAPPTGSKPEHAAGTH